MTEQNEQAAEKTPEQLAAEAAAAQGASEQSPAPEVAKEPEAAVDPAAAPADAPETAEAEFAEEDLSELQPGQTLTALRGIPAGPAPHPRTV